MKKRQTRRETSGLDGEATAHGKHGGFVMYSRIGRQCHCTQGNKEAALLLTSEQGGRLATFNRQSLCSRTVSELQKGQDLPGTCSAHTVHICIWTSRRLCYPFEPQPRDEEWSGVGWGVSLPFPQSEILQPRQGCAQIINRHSLRFSRPTVLQPFKNTNVIGKLGRELFTLSTSLRTWVQIPE